MKLAKDFFLAHDLVICKDSKVKGALPKEVNMKSEGLVKRVIKKPYLARPGLVIETASTIEMGEYRALQLEKKGIVAPETTDEGKVRERLKLKSRGKNPPKPKNEE